MHTKEQIKEALKLGKGNFIQDSRLYLVRCPSCKMENYAMAVYDGICAWCGWPDKVEEKKEVEK